MVILVIALIILGPEKLPRTARTIGRGIGKIRRLMNSFQQEMQAAADGPIEAKARKRGAQAAGRATTPDAGAVVGNEESEAARGGEGTPA